MSNSKDFCDLTALLLAEDSQLAAEVRSAELSIEIARSIYRARVAAGLTQKQLADRMGTKQSCITRIEDEGYGGHSLATLKKVADALGLEVEVSLKPLKPVAEEFVFQSFSVETDPEVGQWSPLNDPVSFTVAA